MVLLAVKQKHQDLSYSSQILDHKDLQASTQRWPCWFVTPMKTIDVYSSMVYPHEDYLVGGLEHQFYFPIYWVSNYPN